MSAASPHPSSPPSFLRILARPYRGRALWPFALSLPVLASFIAHGWRTQTPLEALPVHMETAGALTLLGNGVYALVLFCRAAALTMGSMRPHEQILYPVISKSGRRLGSRKQDRASELTSAESAAPAAHRAHLLPRGAPADVYAALLPAGQRALPALRESERFLTSGGIW